jgi:hypothetical protein
MSRLPTGIVDDSPRRLLDDDHFSCRSFSSAALAPRIALFGNAMSDLAEVCAPVEEQSAPNWAPNQLVSLGHLDAAQGHRRHLETLRFV